MEMLLIGIALGLTIGFCCRWFDIPLPSPPNLVGALLVVFMTLGFMTVDYVISGNQAAIKEVLHDQPK